MQAAGSHEFALSFSLLSSGIIWSFRQVICHSRCHLDSEEKQTRCHSGWRVTHRSNCSGDLIVVWGNQMTVLSVLVPTRTQLAAFTPDKKHRAGKQTGVNLSWSSQIVSDWQHLRTIVGAEWMWLQTRRTPNRNQFQELWIFAVAWFQLKGRIAQHWHFNFFFFSYFHPLV